MANFLFYKYHFEQTKDKHLFSDESGATLTASNLNERLCKDLNDKYKNTAVKSIQLYATHKNRQSEETSEPYNNTIVQIDGRIIMLQIRNNKTKHVMPIDKTEEESVGHYPYCRVIIDTRPESHAILVQYKKDIFPKSEFVIRLLTEYITREYNLSNLGWKVTAEKRICEGTIWDIVHSRIDKARTG